MNGETLQGLADRDAVTAKFISAGMVPAAAADKAALLAASASALAECGIPHTARAVACFVPGRIEVLGKHTDYVGGRSLVAAAECGFCAVAVARADRAVNMTDAADGQHCSFELSAELVPTAGHWSNYPMTVARRIAQNFSVRPGAWSRSSLTVSPRVDGDANMATRDLHGADIAFASDLPPAAGMSSSSALVVMTFLLLSNVNNLPQCDQYAANIHTPEDLAGYLSTIENGQSFGHLLGDRGVGTFGGSEDHTAILCSAAGKLGQYSYCPVRLERRIELSADHVFALASSGVVAEKTGAAMARYNRASALASAAAAIWREATGRDDPHLAAAVASAPDAAERIRKVLRASKHPQFQPADLGRRFEHFLAESEDLIPAVSDRLKGPALAAFGALVDRSQALGAELLGNQVPETIALASQARELGAVAASAFGAGFGGSVWALIARARQDEFLEQWATRYRAAFPARADKARFFTSSPAPAAFLIDDPL